MSKKELEKLTVKELKEHCKTLSIPLKSSDTKDIIVNLVYKKLKKVRFNEKVEKITPKKKITKKTPKKEPKSKEVSKKEPKSKDISKEKSKKNTKENTKKKYDEKNKQPIGYEGKDAIVYEIKDIDGNIYAMKQYKKEVKSEDIKKEVEFLYHLEKSGLTPKVYYVDLKKKFIIMEKFDTTLFDEINTKGLSVKTQKDILDIHTQLDMYGVFHGDPSPLNLMYHNGQLKIIDFGFSRKITPELKKEIGSEKPNYEISTLGLYLKLKEKLPSEKLKTLAKAIPKEYSTLL